MPLTIFRTLRNILCLILVIGLFSRSEDVWPQSSASETPLDNLRKEFFLLKGLSEKFYEKWVAPIRFHLKWQVGQYLPLYHQETRAKVRTFDSRYGKNRVLLDLDLLGVYLRLKEKQNMFGLSLGLHSDSLDTKKGTLVINQYAGRLSWISFLNEWKDGLYHRLDAGVLWNDFYLESDGKKERNKEMGIGFKFGLGEAVKFQKSSLTVEFNYSPHWFPSSINHHLSLNFGFIL